MARALVVVDVQNDFCEGGSVPVSGGAAVADGIARHLATHRDRYALVVATRDWHVDPGTHFVEWPAHCVAGSDGAAFHPGLDADRPFLALIDAVVSKGADAAAYSGFEGTTDDGRGLLELLRTAGIDAVDVCGLATDHCVRATALDARAAGLATRVLLPLVAGVAPDTTATALAELDGAGVELSDDPTPPSPTFEPPR